MKNILLLIFFLVSLSNLYGQRADTIEVRKAKGATSYIYNGNVIAPLISPSVLENFPDSKVEIQAARHNSAVLGNTILPAILIDFIGLGLLKKHPEVGYPMAGAGLVLLSIDILQIAKLNKHVQKSIRLYNDHINKS